MTLFFQISLFGVFPFLIWPVGNAVVSWVLDRCGQGSVPGTAGDVPGRLMAARLIGGLERLLVVIGLVVGSWEVIAAVVALKSVARYKELDDQSFAETFLIGSMASLLWAVLMAILLLVYDGTIGGGHLAALVARLPSGAAVAGN